MQASHTAIVFCALQFGAFSLLGPSAAARQAPPNQDVVAPAALDAAGWLDAMWAALGPPEALESLGTLRMRGAARALTSDFQGTFEEFTHPDGRAVHRIDFEGSDPVLFGVDGRVSWEAWSDQGVAKFDWHAAADWRRFFLHRHAATPGRVAPGAHAPWRALYRDVALGGRAELNQRACVRLVLTPFPARAHGLAAVAPRRQPDPDILWLDEGTRLPVRLEMESLRPAEGEIRLKETLADWREVDGVRFPFKRTLEVPGAGIEFTLTSIEANSECAADAFDMPLALASTVAESYPDAMPLRDNGWRLTDRPAQVGVALRVTCPLVEEDVQVGVGRRALLEFLTDAGVAPSGPLSLRELTRGANSTFELFAPVTHPPEIPADRAGELRTLELPASMMVEGTHVGARARIDESVFRLDYFVRSNDLAAAGAVEELLLVDPDAPSDPTAWHTTLSQPVRPRHELPSGGD